VKRIADGLKPYKEKAILNGVNILMNGGNGNTWRKSMTKYKVIDETGQAMRVFHKKAEAVRFMQDGWSIELLKSPSRYEQALTKVGEALI